MSLVWVLWQKNSPVGWQTAILMVRSLNSHQMATFLPYYNTLNEHRFHLEYLQIPSRHTNDIKHSFIFKKGFINVFYPYNGITWYISPFHYRLMSNSNTTTFLLSFSLNLLWFFQCLFLSILLSFLSIFQRYGLVYLSYYNPCATLLFQWVHLHYYSVHISSFPLRFPCVFLLNH